MPADIYYHINNNVSMRIRKLIFEFGYTFWLSHDVGVVYH